MRTLRWIILICSALAVLDVLVLLPWAWGRCSTEAGTCSSGDEVLNTVVGVGGVLMVVMFVLATIAYIVLAIRQRWQPNRSL